jgi:hypothetical protein
MFLISKSELLSSHITNKTSHVPFYSLQWKIMTMMGRMSARLD